MRFNEQNLIYNVLKAVAVVAVISMGIVYGLYIMRDSTTYCSRMCRQAGY